MMTSLSPFHCLAAPSSPRNVRLMSVTDTSLQVSWWEPARANGLLQGYRVYFLNNNFTSVQTIRDNKSAMVETLTRLSEYIYWCWLTMWVPLLLSCLCPIVLILSHYCPNLVSDVSPFCPLSRF